MKLKISMVSSLAVLFLLVILSGCVTPESTFAPELSLKIGETAKISEIEVTVISVNKTHSVSEIETAGKGKIFVLVDVEIKNRGESGVIFIQEGRDSLGFLGGPFIMTDYVDFSYFQVWVVRKDRLHTDEGLYPKHTMRGKVLFEVPEEAKGLKIVLKSDNLRTPDNKNLPIKVKSVSWVLE